MTWTALGEDSTPPQSQDGPHETDQRATRPAARPLAVGRVM